MHCENLINNIKNDVINEGSLTSILLNCQLLAHEIKLQSLSDWVNNELNGYKEGDIIPTYRYIDVSEVKAIFINRFGVRITEQIPFGLDIPEPFASRLYRSFLNNSVTELEDFATKCKNDPQFNLKLNLHGSFFSVIENCYGSHDGTHYSVQNAWQIFAGQSASGILTAIRSKILDFICQLGELYNCDLTKIDTMEEKQTQIFNSTIYSLNTGSGVINNSDNNVAIGVGATISLNDSEKKQLTELWEELNQLKSQINEDTTELAEYLVELKQEIDKKISCPSSIRKTLRAIKSLIVICK